MLTSFYKFRGYYNGYGYGHRPRYNNYGSTWGTGGGLGSFGGGGGGSSFGGGSSSGTRTASGFGGTRRR